MESRKSPFIIHYAGDEKPWNSPLCDYADVFWMYARQTIFYEAILWRMSDHVINSHFSIFSKHDTRTGARKLADKLLPPGSRRRKFAKFLLPKGSLRWRFCKQIYYIFKPQYRPVKVKADEDTED